MRSVSYRDRSWPRASLEVTTGWAAWCGVRYEVGFSTDDPDMAAGLILASLAVEATETARSLRKDGDLIGVAGEGIVAKMVRDLEPSAHPAPVGESTTNCIIETTGTSEGIASCLGQLVPFGTIILAGPADGQVVLNLYPQVHANGLTVRGVLPSALHAANWTPPPALIDFVAGQPSPGDRGSSDLWSKEDS